MDTQRFDTITSAFAEVQTRRRAFGLITAAAAGALGVSFLAADEIDARRRRGKKGKKGKRGNERCLKSGQSCESDNQCCTNKGLICDVPHGASNSDTECCGGQGAVCGGVDDEGNALPPFCCVGEAGVRSFVCSQNDESNPFVQGTCIPAPDDL